MMLHHGCKANLTIFNKATKRKDARGLTMTFSENMGVLSFTIIFISVGSRDCNGNQEKIFDWISWRGRMGQMTTTWDRLSFIVHWNDTGGSKTNIHIIQALPELLGLNVSRFIISSNWVCYEIGCIFTKIFFYDF